MPFRQHDWAVAATCTQAHLRGIATSGRDLGGESDATPMDSGLVDRKQAMGLHEGCPVLVPSAQKDVLCSPSHVLARRAWAKR